MLKVLVNASTLNIGGGIQISLTFIEQSINYSRISFKYLININIYNSLKEHLKNDPRIIVLPNSPANLASRPKVKRIIENVEREFNPDFVYSVGFPSYHKFSAPEVGRYTNPWEIIDGPLPWHTYETLFSKIRMALIIQYRLYWAKRAKFFDTQTEIAKSGIVKKLKVKSDKIIVIPNSVNPIFINEGTLLDKSNLFEKRNIVFCLAAEHPHKNLNIIPEVATLLRTEFHDDVTFVLTLPRTSKLWMQIQSKSIKLNVAKNILNVGPLKLYECAEYYKQSKIVFLPTLLEIFSATYLEAMAMMVPIVTTDLPFAKDNCGDGAIFFDHRSSYDAASKIHNLLSNKKLYFELIDRGTARLNFYPTPEQKFQRLFNWLENLPKY